MRPEALTANLVGPPRKVTEAGRDYWVVPTTLIVPGVLPGSKGPLAYLPKDISANVEQWNGVPLTIRHPFDPLTNEHLSAADPGVWERQGIGQIREAEYGGKLRAEAWVDIDRANRVDKRIVNSIEQGRALECSTGLYTTQVPAPNGATMNGKPFTAYAKGHVADHVAVLPDEKGACSIADGCGLLVNAWHPGPEDDCDGGGWGGGTSRRSAVGNSGGGDDDSCSCGGSCEHCKEKAEQLMGGKVTGVQGKQRTVSELAGNASHSALELADFVTLPNGISGTNCSNCLYQKNGNCTHPKLTPLKVTKRECCAYWDAEGTKRPRSVAANSNPEGHNQYTIRDANEASFEARKLSNKAKIASVKKAATAHALARDAHLDAAEKHEDVAKSPIPADPDPDKDLPGKPGWAHAQGVSSRESRLRDAADHRRQAAYHAGLTSNDANFVSEQQRKFMWSQHPDIAESWAHGEHTADDDHRMPAGPGPSVKGPMAKAVRKRKAKRQATANFLHRLDQLWVANGKVPVVNEWSDAAREAAAKARQASAKASGLAASIHPMYKDMQASGRIPAHVRIAHDALEHAKVGSHEEAMESHKDAIEELKFQNSQTAKKYRALAERVKAGQSEGKGGNSVHGHMAFLGNKIQARKAVIQAHENAIDAHGTAYLHKTHVLSEMHEDQRTHNEWSDAARAAALLARQASLAARKASNAAGSPKGVGLGGRSFSGDAGKKALAASKLAIDTAEAGLGKSHPLGPDSYHRKAAVLHESAAREHETAADSAHKQGHPSLGMLHSQAAQSHKRAANLHMIAAGQVTNRQQMTANFVVRLDQLREAAFGRPFPVGDERGAMTDNWCNQYGGTTCREGSASWHKQRAKDIARGSADATGSGPGRGRAAGGAAQDVRRVAKGAGKPRPQGHDREGAGEGVPADHEAVAAVGARLDRYAKVFRAKGEHEAAEWMEMLKEHISTIGVDHALAALGEQHKGGFTGKVQYEGAYDDPGDTQKESDFIRAYLRHAGVTLVHGNTAVDPKAPLVSGWSEANLKQEGRDRTARAGDYIPTDATFKNKLEETQHLPGLESTQDIHDAVGHKVTSFTPEVLKALDAKYGKGGWIVKSYGDEAYAGFGVMFPQRVKQIQQDAKATIAAAADELKGHGYRIARDEDGTAIGLKKGGSLMHFGSKEFDALPKAVRTLGKQAQQAAPSENGTRLPTSPEQSLQNNYGVTLRRDKDGVPNGIVDWDGKEHALDSKHVARMEEQDGGAMGHELHRALEADEWRRKGFSTEPKFMVGPAFKAVGVSASDRALGATWETANEGRVHCITRDGKASVVPYATLAGRGDSMPAVFATQDVRDMEKAVEDAVNKLPASERAGQLYAPDVVKTKDGWRVLELNPAAAGGGSDWLGRNPFVMDAVASHAVGREPMHARFIRDVIAKATGKGNRPDAVPPAPPSANTPPATPDEQGATRRLNPSLTQPLGGGKVAKDLTGNMAQEQPRDDHGRWSGAGNAVQTVKLGHSKVRFRERAPKRIDGPKLGLKNYRQKDEHSCSYVAALTVAHHFDKSTDPTDVLKVVRPTKAGGLSRAALRQGLRSLGIETRYKKDLTVGDLRKHVANGTPVMLTVFPKDWSSDHWTVVEGFSGKGADTRIHLSNHKSMSVSQFKEEWYDGGEGLICTKKQAKPTANKCKDAARFIARLDELWTADTRRSRVGREVPA